MEDLILLNGVVHTMDGRTCEAVAVRGERILKVGSSEDIEQLKHPGTQMVDVGGRAVLPGFIDTHAHLVGYGASLNAVDLSGAESVEELIVMCRDYIQANGVSPGQWIAGRGWNQNRFTQNPVFPTRKELDRISTAHPILLLRVCGHIGVANSMALENAGVTNETEIHGGCFDKDETGALNGVIREAALEWFKKRRTGCSSKEMIRQNILLGGRKLLMYGITSVHSEDSYDLGYSGPFMDIYDTYRAMSQAGELPVRVYQKIALPARKDVEEFLRGSLRTGMGDDSYRIGPMKQWCDGTMGARTAALLAPYADDPQNCGIHVYEEETLYENVLAAHLAGMQVCLHAIGDGALNRVLNVYERILAEHPRELRHRIVHGQVGSRSLYERLAKLDVSVNIQAAQTASDWGMMRSRLGAEREPESHNWRTLTDLGVCLTGGSDIPVEPPDVLFGIHASVNRTDRNGNPSGGWLPDQKLTVDEAIRTYTVNAAYSAFEEKIKGTITEGKLADLVVVDRDPYAVDPERLMDIGVDITILGGRVVYER